MGVTPIEIVATVLFGLALCHTFLVKRFEHLAHRYPEGSMGENLFHLLGEIEVVFGLWATIFLIVFAALHGGGQAIAFLEGRWSLPGQTAPVQVGFTEPLFVFVIMAMAATKPVLALARGAIDAIARLLPLNGALGFFVACLVIGPLLGSFITEPAAMTVTALLLKERVFDCGASMGLRYATIGLLFVSVSIGGALTAFAAPPVVMVAEAWNLGTLQMMGDFGWKAALVIVAATTIVALRYRKELVALEETRGEGRVTTPVWLMIVHALFIAGVVYTNHHPVAFLGIFLLFLGVTQVSREHQDDLRLREALLVAYFLVGLVVLGALQRWWLEPTLTSLSDTPLMLSSTALTAFTDNAALTYLGSLVPDLSTSSQYALLAGAIAGGGLTIVANAPNPAGYGILKGCFGPDGMSPLGLMRAALVPTGLAVLAFMFLPNL